MYCNYSKDKFDNEITFIIPCWIDLPEGVVNALPHVTREKGTIQSTLKGAKEYVDASNIRDQKLITTAYLNQLLIAENSYFQLLEGGWIPQQARAVLPNSLKTELVMTGFVSDWKHFFELRCASSAHPQARELAEPLYFEFIKRGYFNEKNY